MIYGGFGGLWIHQEHFKKPPVTYKICGVVCWFPKFPPQSMEPTTNLRIAVVPWPWSPWNHKTWRFGSSNRNPATIPLIQIDPEYNII